MSTARPKRIGMLLEGRFPPDIRVENEALTLARHGFEIHIFCLSFEDQPLMEQFSDRVFVHRRRISKAVFNKLHITILHFPLYRKFWERFVQKCRIPLDGIHIHDLPLACVGLRLSKRWGIPLILDFHENYPAALKIWEHAQKRLAQPFLNYERWRRYEQDMVAQADRVILVVDEAEERFTKWGFSEEKFVVVSNTLNTTNFPNADEEKAEGIRGSDFIILYAGGLEIHRGLETGIEAISKILQALPQAKLLIVGRGRNQSLLEHLAKVRGITERVKFIGWVPFQEIPTYTASCHVYLIPSLQTEHTNTTLPHKLFQAWYLEKPVVVSDCRPLKRVVQEVDGGLVFQAGNPEDLAGQIIRLKDPQLRQEMGKKGKQAVLHRYNWLVDGQRLVQLYRELLHGDRIPKSLL